MKNMEKVKKSKIVWAKSTDVEKEVENAEKLGYELVSIQVDCWEKYKTYNDENLTDASKYLLHFRQPFAQP